MRGLFPWEISTSDTCADKIKHSIRGRSSNDKGLEMEKMILQGAEEYLRQGRCRLVKIPEPFRVLKKEMFGRARIQFVAHAEPDFIGCLKGGSCIAFESKYTGNDIMKFSALTEIQARALELYWRLGAVAGVCCGIQDKYYWVPWHLFGRMKEHYGRLYIRPTDISQFEVRFTGYAIKFLEYRNGTSVDNIELWEEKENGK